ncbi:MAG TPA: NAD+ synthase [Thermoplasmataceae archaeon]|nr:NAD+ synthase [Thermoplasmatales archaeon AK]HLH85917.1 NAD+ synthase [Thermoplasmataceae archaeon]
METFDSALELDRIANFLKRNLGNKPAVIGVSGGIDSALTLTILSNFLPKEKIHAFFLPDGSTPGKDYRDVEELEKSTGVLIRILSIERMVKQFVEALNATDKKLIGNIKSRVRMIVLYYQANLTGGLVVGTTNKSEYLTGYFTKYGDGACDIEPIMHLYKWEVRKLSTYLGVPKSILEKSPSAGLWQSQTDEEELGMPYDKLDRILRDLEQGNPDTDREAIRVLEMYHNTEHKRRMPVSILDES